jgi:hypothetical protein
MIAGSAQQSAHLRMSLWPAAAAMRACELCLQALKRASASMQYKLPDALIAGEQNGSTFCPALVHFKQKS